MNKKELPKTYLPKEIEPRLARMWEQGGYAGADNKSSKKPFVIAMPPVNANGILHVGHASFLTYEDIMVRYHRMKGEEALWIPGTDHAGIQTQAVFEKQLKKTTGKTRDDLGRDEFYRQLFQFCMDNKHIINSQIRMMGASCDWSREKFTLDADLVRQVKQTFVDMFHDGIAYRSYRITNWCPECKTTLANIEVEHKDMETTLYYIKYTEELTVATVRPETKLADTAVAVHPDDKRYAHLVGKEFDILLAKHSIHVKVIADKGIDPSFGSGALGVTPAHSEIDFKMAQKNELPMIQLIEMDGKLNDHGGRYAGMTVMKAREAFVADLRASGQIVKEEPYTAPIAVCERTGNVIEPLLSTQWFIKVDELKRKAIQAVKSGETRLLPSRFEKQYFHWMENLEDWNISRQIWWGPDIPAWYCEKEGCGEIIVQMDAPTTCPKCGGAQLRKDPDTFDTWFSSGQWPYTILGGIGAPDYQRFYPTTVLETGWDILFFWVTRMIMLGLYRTKKSPFETVYLHGLILDKQGRKMSKSKGNVVNPVEMIEQFSADALRLSLVVGAKPGQNMQLYPEKIAGFHATMNKMWNIGRFILTQEKPESLKLDKSEMSVVDHWILSRLQKVTRDTTRLIDEYQFGEAARALLAFTREEFADWYIEIAKIEKTETARQLLYIVLQRVLRLLHPFIPFITEELWSFIEPQGEKLIREKWPMADEACMNDAAEKEFATIQELISAVRNIRAEQKILPQKLIAVTIVTQDVKKTELIRIHKELFAGLAKVESLEVAEKQDEGEQRTSVIIKDMQVSVSLVGLVDKDKERANLEEEKIHVMEFIATIEKKLKNKKFVQNAPDVVVTLEKEKLADQQKKLEAIEQKINHQ